MRAREILEGWQERDIQKAEWASKTARQITTKQAQEMIPSIQVALSRTKAGFSIYRGLGYKINAPFFFLEPGKARRISANTHNYMNILVSTLPSWEEYPPRDRSLICASKDSNARGYGQPYVIYPLGDPAIGIVRDIDFWDGFVGLDVQTWNDRLDYKYREFARRADLPNVNLSQEPKQFAEQLYQIGEFMQSENANDFVDLAKDMPEVFNRDPVRTLNSELSPENNNFDLTTLSEYSVSGNCEVWFSAPALAVHHLYRNEIELSS